MERGPRRFTASRACSDSESSLRRACRFTQTERREAKIDPAPETQHAESNGVSIARQVFGGDAQNLQAAARRCGKPICARRFAPSRARDAAHAEQITPCEALRKPLPGIANRVLRLSKDQAERR